MPVRETSRVDAIIRQLIDRIVSGEFAQDSTLPSEERLAEQSGVSRLTVREAVKVLTSQNVLRSVQGKGTYVTPADQWVSLDALIRLRHGEAAEAIAQLTEVRAMIEIGAAELFAPLADDDTLGTMHQDLDRMKSAHLAIDVADFVHADMDFHNRILTGCGNPFVAATFSPISDALREARTHTSSIRVIREHAIAEHTQVLRALSTRSAQDSSAAMRSHLIQTRDDARKYLSNSH